MVMKSGIVLEGGSFRGLFTAGALDCLIENDIMFDYGIGVSAGAGNLLNLITRQNLRMKNLVQATGKDSYIGFNQIFKCGSFLNLNRMVYEFPYKQFPLDFEAYDNSKMESEFVVTDASNGKARYIGNIKSHGNLLKTIKASCSLPFICKTVKLGKNYYVDGSLADSIPVKRAIDKGCDKILVILTRRDDEKPTDYSRKSGYLKLCEKRYPGLLDTIMKRAKVYDKQREYLSELEKEKKVYIIRPTENSISRFELDRDKQDAFYQHGYDRMKANLEDFKNFLLV